MMEDNRYCLQTGSYARDARLKGENAELRKVNRELRSVLTEVVAERQDLRTIELTQSWIIGAMSGAVFIFLVVVILHTVR